MPERSTNEAKLRLTLIGPLPPPVHGQSMVMRQIVIELAPRFPQMRVADTGAGSTTHKLTGPIAQIRRTVTSWRSIRGASVVYIAVKASKGMWLTTASAGLARLMGAQVLLHHHSYIYVRERKVRMVALARAAGSSAVHIVLSRSMERDLRRTMPEIHRTLVVGNAGLIDQALLDLPLKANSQDLVLGHLSNLSFEKGIAEVVDLAVALSQAGFRRRLVVGGPTLDDEALRQLDRAARELGESFEYRGQLTGEGKREFFREVTHFVFPSRNEAAPLVLYEAMAAGAVCVTTRQGSIPEQLEGSPCLIAANAESFVEETLPALAAASTSTEISHQCRQAYLQARSASDRQLADLLEIIGNGQ